MGSAALTSVPDRGSPYSARSSRDRRRAIRTTRLVDYSEALLEDLSRRSADETPYIAPQRTDRDRKLRRCDSADPLDHEIDLLSKLGGEHAPTGIVDRECVGDSLHDAVDAP